MRSVFYQPFGLGIKHLNPEFEQLIESQLKG